jgi:hypothetical protein
MSPSFIKDRRGSVLTEFALVLPLFLILLFAIVDFGQIYLRWILAEKATDVAARIAAVRPPVCAGVTNFNDQTFVSDFLEVPFGTSCIAFFFLCQQPSTRTCTGAQEVGDTFDEIIERVGALLPATIAPANLRFSYRSTGLGFLGGPYIPTVTVEIVGDVEVPFITPLGPLLQSFYGGGPGLDNPSMPAMRATLPAEDLIEGGPG